jgi:Zn-dependent protease with chaperone function
MIAPLQQILLIFIISAYPAVGAVTSGHLSSWTTLWVVLGGNLSLVLAALQFRKRALRRMDHAADPLAVLGTFEQNLQRLRSMSIGWLAINLFFMDWGRVVRTAPWRLPHGAAYTWLPLDPIIWLALPVLVWICFWLAQYGPEALVNARETAISGRHGRRFHPMPTRRQYVILQMRTNLYLILLVLVIWTVQRGSGRLADGVGLAPWASVIGFIPILLLLLFTGKILSMVWSTQSMPEGALRGRLLAMARRSGIGFSDVRIWNTHHRIINGAVIGPTRVARYVILSDALLENLGEREVEAVFAHELGHGYHRHILWYLAAIFAVALVSSSLGSLLQLRYPQDGQLLAALTMLVMVLFIVYGISRISRLCEHQADWFAAQRMGEELSAAASQVGGDLERASPPIGPPASSRAMDSGSFLTPWLIDYSAITPATASPLVRGAEAFSMALRRVVELSGRSPEKPGWMHPSVNQRTQLLANLAVSADAVRHFEGRMRRLRHLIRWGLLIGLVSVVMAVALAPATGQPGVSPRISPAKTARPPHFSRVSGEWTTRNTAVDGGPVEPAGAAIADPLAR